MKKTLIVIGCIILGLVLTDCSVGYTKTHECNVIRHEYVPPSVSVDSDGDLEFEPEEFHLICEDLGNGERFDVNVKEAIYESKQDNQYVSVKVRYGRWTSAGYLNWIND